MAASKTDSRDRPTFERILDTAATLFWEKGYAATTTREIAAKVGIQQASLYYHVSSKEDLLYQLGVASLEQIRTDVQAAVDPVTDPLDRIRVFIHAHLVTLLRQQIRHVTVVTHLHGLSEPHRANILALRKGYADFVRALIDDAQQAGVLRVDISANYLCLALLNLLNWAVFWFRPELAPSVDHAADLFEKIFLEGALLAQGRPRRPALDLSPQKRTRVQKKLAAPTQERMLDHAAELFARQGYTATSTREIASALGIRKASLYHHIENKEDLLFEICKRAFEQIRADAEAALSAVSDPMDRIRVLIHTHVQSLLRHQDKHSTARSEMHLLSPRRRGMVTSLQQGYEELVCSVLRDAQKAGALRKDVPAQYLAFALLGLLNRITVWYRRSGPLSSEQLGRMLTTLFLTGSSATSRT